MSKTNEEKTYKEIDLWCSKVLNAPPIFSTEKSLIEKRTKYIVFVSKMIEQSPKQDILSVARRKEIMDKLVNLPITEKEQADHALYLKGKSISETVGRDTDHFIAASYFLTPEERNIIDRHERDVNRHVFSSAEKGRECRKLARKLVNHENETAEELRLLKGDMDYFMNLVSDIRQSGVGYSWPERREAIEIYLRHGSPIDDTDDQDFILQVIDLAAGKWVKE